MPAVLMESGLEILEEMFTNHGKTVMEMSSRSPVLLVFLRHFGCVFCKEAMDDLSVRREEFLKSGIQLVLVHMADDETAQAYFNRYGLQGVASVSDPQQRFYSAFGLHRGTFSQLYGLHVWMRGFKIKAEQGYSAELARKLGDSTQMPGVFMLQDGQVKESFIHQHAAQRPNYDELVRCCTR